MLSHRQCSVPKRCLQNGLDRTQLFYNCFNVIFVTFEVNQTVMTFVSTTLVTNCDTSVVVSDLLLLFNETSKDFSGVLVVISAKSKEVILRRPFVVGL